MSYQSDLIFDLGLHKGEDTKYYLQRGFKVVALEADPDLVSFCSEKFDAYIASGKLIIVNGAISDTNKESVTFYKNESVSVWGTVRSDWAERNSRLGAGSVEVVVPVVKLRDLFSQFGVPYYLKIDIEGMDLCALKELADVDSKPKYVSLESEKVDFSSLEREFQVFRSLGYDRFRIVQQEYVPRQKIPADSEEGEPMEFQFERGASGLFGSDLRGEWVAEDQALDIYRGIFKQYRFFGDRSAFRRFALLRMAKTGFQKLTGIALPGWYDTHARLR